MKLGSLAVLAVCMLGALGSAWAGDGATMSKAELRALSRMAPTPENYQTLASYYRAQEQLFRAKAKQENEDLERYLAHPSGSPKFPTRGDTARSLRDYYGWKANVMAARARKYEPQAPQLSTDNSSSLAARPAAVGPALSADDQMLLNRIQQLEQQVKELRASAAPK